MIEVERVDKQRDCKHCSRTYGTLGCCSTVSNKWVYSCEEGHREYEEKHKHMTIPEAIEVLAQDLPCETDEDLSEAMTMAIKALEQKEKTAAWVPTDEEPHEVYECNACGWLLYDVDRTDFKYCPNCGARMVSE